MTRRTILRSTVAALPAFAVAAVYAEYVKLHGDPQATLEEYGDAF
jgi:hypothetical protein